MNTKNLLDRYPGLVSAVKIDAVRFGKERGHGFYNILSVAEFGRYIAPDDQTAELAWVSGLVRAVPRIFQIRDWPEISTKIFGYLRRTSLSFETQSRIVQAVFDHRRLPTEGGVIDILAVVLREANWLANLAPSHIIRAGAFRPGSKVYDPRFMNAQDPDSTFTNPTSHVENLRSTLEWLPLFTLPKAIPLAREYGAFVEHYLTMIRQEVDLIWQGEVPEILLV